MATALKPTGPSGFVRLDRVATLSLFHPLSRAAGMQCRDAILMYHSITDDAERGVRPYFRINTAPLRFARHMALLSSEGWAVVPLAELIGPSRTVRQRARRVAITFDDGYADFLRHAFPVLQERGFPASVFLPTDFIGDTAIAFNGRECLTWSQVRELSDAGVEFGSHTASHPQLHSLASAVRGEELRRSKQAIEQRLGRPAPAFSYPFAFPQHDTTFRGELRSVLVDCGYRYGVCTILGRLNRNDDVFFAPRLPVNSLDDEALLRAKLEGGYDWLRGLQHLAKVWRRR